MSQATLPVVLIGHSWGARLSWIVAATYPHLVRKLILVGCPPFEEHDVHLIRENPLRALTPEQQLEFVRQAETMDRSEPADATVTLRRLGELAGKGDAYDPIALEVQLPIPSVCHKAGEIYAGVWPQAASMRRTGELLELAARIECPVVAIQGDRDPHPVAGVREPLAATVHDFQMLVLENCGHEPWRERHAVDTFYAVLERELAT